MNKLELFKNLEQCKTEKAKIKKSDIPTFLSIINKDYAETYISSLIAYTLKNDKSLLESLILHYYAKYSKENTDVRRLLKFDLSNVEINLEQYMDGKRADIVVIIDEIKTTITIENKTNTWEHDEQTVFYYNWIKKKYSNYNNAFFYLHPDYNLSSPSSTEFYDIKYSEFNKLISKSNDVIITDLKNHIKQKLENNKMEFEEYEKIIIDNFQEYRNIIDIAKQKINSKKSNIIEQINNHLKLFIISNDKELDKSTNQLFYQTCLENGTLGSYRLYRSEWYFKDNNNEYYFYVEIKFANKNNPFENITFQQTIKGYNESRKTIRNFINTYSPKIKLKEDSDPYFVIDKTEFDSTNLNWNTIEWEEKLIFDASETINNFIKSHDNVLSDFKKWLKD